MNFMRRLTIVVSAMLLAAGACSLPTDDEAAIIDPEELPNQMQFW